MDLSVSLQNILFLDIETVPQYPVFDDMPERFQKLWEKKASTLYNTAEDDTPASLYERAGIYAEFGKIVCISVGFITPKNELRIKSFAGDDEHELLSAFAGLLNNYYPAPYKALCGHNAKEFDFPYIARRMLVNGITVPRVLDTPGKKPWEVDHIDTMQMWKYGDYKTYTSLDLLAAIFGIETPKDDIDGSMIYEVYYRENDLNRIVEYCQKDVVTVVQVYCRMRGLPLIEKDKIMMV